MTLTSLSYAAFVAITIIIYYSLPMKKYQWVVLLIASYFFYVYNSFQYSFFIIFTTVTVYFTACRLKDMQIAAKKTLKENKGAWSRQEKKDFKKAREKEQKVLLVLLLVVNFGILFMLKYFNFMAGGLVGLLHPGPDEPTVFVRLLLPLGISFYTFQAMGYLIDVYRETVEPERHFLKFALFVSFFPQIVQGPISEFGRLGPQLTEEHSFRWHRVKIGLELILWGLFKKLIIADRAVNAINQISGDYTSYSGQMITFAAVLYALQLYADFSGGIDIVRGVSCILGIDLDLNFRQPYFSRSLNEYWRRWHITLGAWMKKYVFYSLAVSDRFLRLSRWIGGSSFGSTAAGKHLAKTLPAAIASFVVFLLIGIWHGANSRYIGFGVWNGLVIMLATLLEPLFLSWIRVLKINAESRGWQLFQMVRTFILVLIGYYFDIAPNYAGAIDMMKRSVFDNHLIITVSQLHDVGLRVSDMAVLFYGLVVLLWFSIRLERTGKENPGELLDGRALPLQWLVIAVGIISILVFGIYGPGYDPADFVYMGF